MIRNQQGMAIAFFALVLVASIGIGAMVIDISQTYSLRSRIKNGVDLAGLAGISQLNSQSNVSDTKNLALNYLNNNLTMTIASFQPLGLSSEGLSIQVGVYDTNTMTFTWDEANPAVNALMISYTYNSMSYLANIFMITNTQVSESTTVAKQIATQVSPGSGFPLVLYSTALNGIEMNGYMINLYSAGNMDNSYWSDFTSSNPSTTDVRNVLNYFQSGNGTRPPGITVNDLFRVNDGGMGGIFMDMNPSILIGMTYLFAVVTPTMDNEVMADGFLGATIDNIVDSMGQKYVSITVMPGYIDNTFGGLQIGTGMTNVTPSNQPLLANSFGLVQ